MGPEYVEFTMAEKAEMFDRIAERFYCHNFGQTSKTDLELLMFHFYIENLTSSNKDDEGIIAYNSCSDYKISKDLGITQQRVRNLKVKEQLVYPSKFEWEKALASVTANARFEKSTRMISINIPDPNLFIEIQNFVEEEGGYIDMQLNSKLLKIRLEYYIQLIMKIDGEDSEKKALKKISKIVLQGAKDEENIEGMNLSKALSKVNDCLPIVTELASIDSPIGLIATSLIKLLK